MDLDGKKTDSFMILYSFNLALMVATDQDLHQIGLGKGPRIKILRSMDVRRRDMEVTTESGDTQF